MSRRTAHGTLPRPFDLHLVDARFDASGADVRDLYYLVGVRLPNTGTLHLNGRMMRQGRELFFENLKLVTGQSDVQGRVSVGRQKSGRTRVHAELSSALLRLADVGLRAAGRDPHPDAPRKLFSEVPLITAATRRVDATGEYKAWSPPYDGSLLLQIHAQGGGDSLHAWLPTPMAT